MDHPSNEETPDDGALVALRQPVPLPKVGTVLDDVRTHEHATESEAIGAGLRTALGIGALALLPDMIEELRRTRDLDAKIKFVQLALKEGGYGVKDNKHDHLPVFNFTFVGNPGAPQQVQVVQEVSKDEIEDAVIKHTDAGLNISDADMKRLASLAEFACINDDFASETQPVEPPEPVSEAQNIFDQIEGLFRV
jgi:hypothetical protein